MVVIIGLGNPGKEYANTRHNVGFTVVDTLAKKLGVEFTRDRYLLSEYAVSGKVVLVKPLTYMNMVKDAVSLLIKKFNLTADNILVVHDDADLPIGKIKVKQGGSSAGHHGIESLDQILGSNYWRIRIGIGRDKNSRSLTRHVLSVFNEGENQLIKLVIDRTCEFLLGSISEQKLESLTLNVKES